MGTVSGPERFVGRLLSNQDRLGGGVSPVTNCANFVHHTSRVHHVPYEHACPGTPS